MAYKDMNEYLQTIIEILKKKNFKPTLNNVVVVSIRTN